MTQPDPSSGRLNPQDTGMSAAAGTFLPTHTVPAWGLEIWNSPDVSSQPTGLMPAGTGVRVIERGPHGLVRVTARGGQSGWADGRHLQEIPDSGTAAEMELLAQLKTSLETYGQLLDDLAAHRIDAATFRRRAFRAGLIVREGNALMLDAPSGQWYRYNGVDIRPMGPPLNPPGATGPDSQPT
jgi:hypothetical protein